MSEVRKTYTWRSLIALLVATIGAGAVVGFLTQQDKPFTQTL